MGSNPRSLSVGKLRSLADQLQATTIRQREEIKQLRGKLDEITSQAPEPPRSAQRCECGGLLPVYRTILKDGSLRIRYRACGKCKAKTKEIWALQSTAIRMPGSFKYKLFSGSMSTGRQVAEKPR